MTSQDKYALNSWDFKYDFKFILKHIHMLVIR